MRARTAALIALAVLVALPAGAQLSRDYPRQGKALDTVRPAADYNDMLTQRPRAVAIIRARAHGFVPSAELQAYVKSIVTRLTEGIALPASFTPDVRILAAPDFGALCTPDGTIVVSVGLLGQVESEDELAFILAHEISHAILRHHGSDWFTRAQYYAILNAKTLDDSTKLLQQAAPAANIDLTTFQRGLDLATKVYALSESVLAPQFQQGQEDEADALGLDLLIKAGYSPAGAGRALEHLGAAETAAAQMAQAAEAATRPQTGSGMGGRIGALGGFALGALTGTGPRVENLRTEDVMLIGTEALGAATESLAKETKAHRPAQQRADMLAAYQFREYRDLVPGDLQPLAWGRKDDLGQSLVTLLTNYRAADAAGDYVQARQQPAARGPTVVEARRAAEIAVRAPTADHAYTQYALARLQVAEGRPAEAAAARQAALRSAEPSWIAYNAEIDEKLARSSYAEADAVMSEAVRRFEDSPVLLPKRIRILQGLGRAGEARQMAGQCRAYDVKELAQQCDAALAGG